MSGLDDLMAKLPHPDEIRKAIDEADQAGKELRRILRALMALRMDYYGPGNEKLPPAQDRPEPERSPMFLLAVLASARRSGDQILERTARERLGALNVRVIFDAEKRV